MKKILIRIALVAAGFASLSSQASTIDLTFEGVGNYARVNDFYNGGTDSNGNAGPNYGISFSSSSLGLVQNTHGGSGNFQNPSSGDTVLFFTSDTAVMNDAVGFTTGFSFFYAASGNATVTVYSGVNKTGSVLATLTLPSNYQSCGFCQFDSIGMNFDGIAHSVDFGGAANYVAFDDITIGSAVAGAKASASAAVPEPESFLLLGLGVVALAAARRQARR